MTRILMWLHCTMASISPAECCRKSTGGDRDEEDEEIYRLDVGYNITLKTLPPLHEKTI